MRRNVTPAVPSRRPPHSHHPPPSAPAASPANAKCQQPPSHSPPLKTDTFRWSIVIPAISLALLARSLVTALRQASAAGPHAHPPPSFQQLLLANFSIAQLLLGCLPRCLVTLILAAACSAATLLAPSWYLQGGREQLLAVARLLPKAITVLQLLLLPSHPLGELQRVWLQTCIVGAKGLLAVMIWPAVFPTPVRSYLKLAPLECGLALAADCMFTFRTSSPPAFPPFSRIATLALLYAVCGFAIPAALLMCNHPLQRQRRLLVPLETTTSLPQATCTTPSDARPPKTGPPPDFALPNCHEESAAAPTLQPPAQLERPPQSATPICSTVARLAAVGATAELSSTPSGGPAPHSKCSLYRSRNTVKVLSIKIHDHQAYPCREAILASITATLQTPQATSPTILLTTCAVEGCLQLLITASTLDGTDPIPFPLGGDLPSFFCQLHAQLPANCVDGLVTIHMDATLAVFGGATGQQLPPELLHLPGSAAGEGLQWAPICFEAGSAELELLLSNQMVEGVQAVVQFRRQGEEVEVKLPVQLVAGSAGKCRLQLPAGLDTGPVAVHLLSTQEGRHGVLLGSATTMALPPPAAAEVQQAYSTPDSTASADEFRSALRGLLRDYALCWRLGRGRQQAEPCPAPAPVSVSVSGSLPHPPVTIGTAGVQQPPMSTLERLLSNVLQYLSSGSMPACRDLLLAHTASPATPAPAGGLPKKPPPPAAAASTATAAGEATTCSVAPVAAPVLERVPLGSLSQRGPATLAQRLAARVSRIAAVSRSPRYAAWRLQQRRWVDVNGWAFAITMYAVGSRLIGKRLPDDGKSHTPRVLSMATSLLHVAAGVGTHVLLAVVVGRRVRARREKVVLLFAVARLVLCLAAVLSWLPTPATVRVLWATPRAVVVIHGVCRPCLMQVPWRLQLLVSFIEEAAKYAALTLAPCNITAAQLPSGQYARNGIAVVVVAVAMCWLLEVLYLSLYARLFGAQAATGKHEPAAQSHENIDCSKAKADHKKMC